MNGRGVIVYGAEASGTRFVTMMLSDARVDASIPVTHCSVPYDTRHIPLHEIMGAQDRNDTRVVVTSRRIDVLAMSQVANGHAADDADALRAIHRALAFAVGECVRMSVPFLLTTYEAFGDPGYRRYVARWALGDVDEDGLLRTSFVDGNEKYL